MNPTMKRTRSGLQVVLVCGTLNIEAQRLRAARAAAGGRLTIVVGIVRSALSNCWYVGLARQGGPLAWVSAHRLKRDAEEQVQLVLYADQEGDLRDDATWQRLLHDLAARSEQELGDPQAEPLIVSREPRVPRRGKARGDDEEA